MDLVFLDLEDVLRIHEDRIDEYGGSGGVRDLHALESAIAQPHWVSKYCPEDIAAVAATYLFHIVKNHPFVDGNKRAGLGAMTVFLDLNGYTTTVDDDALVDFTLGIADGRVEKDDATERLRSMIALKPE